MKAHGEVLSLGSSTGPVRVAPGAMTVKKNLAGLGAFPR